MLPVVIRYLCFLGGKGASTRSTFILTTFTGIGRIHSHHPGSPDSTHSILGGGSICQWVHNTYPFCVTLFLPVFRNPSRIILVGRMIWYQLPTVG